ncbi:type IV pilus modification protein PilV [Ralstonia insidiosa]|nr:type IV pilus modification protein PilV [Ralstonia insidiosa]
MNASLLKSTSRGYALLEALIALLVISVGLIGFSRLQLVGMSSSNISTQRSKAVYLAYEISDRIRANLSGYSAGAYSNLSGTASNPGCVSASTGCSAAQIAQKLLRVVERTCHAASAGRRCGLPDQHDIFDRNACRTWL